MDNLTAARTAMGVSLAFHIIFAALGVGLPVLLMVAEGLGLRNRDATWYALARRWGKAFGVLFVVGAVSGTTLSFEFGLLWPRFMGFASAVIGLPFALEGFAFFLEAIFLGLYLYGWERLSPRAHWLCTIPLVVSGAASAWFVVTANAWMNTPAGFTAVNGKVTSVDPIAAIFNPSTPTQTIHSLLACYQVTGFAVAAVYAFALLRGRNDAYHRRGLALGVLLGTVIAPIQAIVGDASARHVAEFEPAKLAAMEALFQTTVGAPLRILGIPDPNTGQVHFSIEIPRLLSLLAFGDPNAKVQGLDAFPREYWPDIITAHLAFDTMVGLGILMILVPIWYWTVWYRRGKTTPVASTWLLRALVALGPLSFLALEAGWIVTERGRQPWIIHNVMLVKDGVTPAPGVGLSLLLFVGIYVALAVTTALLLRRIGRQPKVFTADEEHPPISAEVS
jgi:cytochrome bd ubiquinol oxidase subunit I